MGAVAKPVVPVDDIDDREDHRDDPDRYEPVAEHARGGLGKVVRAVDKRLGRTVAVKELLRRDPSHEALFMREALITARLEHPGIVPVHEAGRWPNGDPYYVMKLVEGRTLKELICETHTMTERLALLPHVIAVADAVGYAHSEGVIHRDLKPSNVIVGAFGETIVVDWGLACDRHRHFPELTLAELQPLASQLSTVSGKVVGTPAYMSPEQARGDGAIDERADVYAIGAVLYELLAGMTPHTTPGALGRDETPQQILDRVVAGPPMPLHELVHGVPSELETIVAKAMEREPAKRYANARVLAEDLRRFQTGKLVSAHSYTMWSLIRRKLAANRGAVGVAIASALALAAVGIESFRRVVDERNEAQAQRDVASKAVKEQQQQHYKLLLTQANTSLRKDPTASLAWLKKFFETAQHDHVDVTSDERAQITDIIDEAKASGVAKDVFRTGSWVFDALFTPDGKKVVSTTKDGKIAVFDLQSHARTLIGRSLVAADQMVLSADGAFAITGGMTGEVIAWPIDGGPERHLATGTAAVKHIAIDTKNPRRYRIDREVGPPEVVTLDGTPPSIIGPTSAKYQIIVADDNWKKQVGATSRNEISAITGNSIRSIAHTDRKIDHIALSPDGETVVFHDGETVWAVPFTGGKMRVIAKYDKELEEIKWNPSENHKTMVAIVGKQYDIPLVDVETGKLLQDLRGHTDALYNVQFTKDGESLLSASDDGTARMWSLTDGTSTVMAGHDDDVYRAHLSFDERKIATASLDGSVRVWNRDLGSSRMYTTGQPVWSVKLAGNYATTLVDKALTKWDLVTGKDETVLSWADARSLGRATPSPNGKRVVIQLADFAMEIRCTDGTPLTLRGHTAPINALAWSRDSSTLYSGSADGSVRRWDLSTGNSTVVWDGLQPVTAIEVSAAGKVYGSTLEYGFSIDADGTMHASDSNTAQVFVRAWFDQLGGRMMVQRPDSTLALIDPSGATTELDTNRSPLVRYSVSTDGKFLAGAMVDRVVRVWSFPDGRLLKTLRGHSDLVQAVAFSPDGTQLASTSYDKTIWVWDLTTSRHRVLRGHSGAVMTVAWRDNKQLVTGSVDGTLRLWNVPPLTLAEPTEVASDLGKTTSAVIDDLDHATTTTVSTHGS